MKSCDLYPRVCLCRRRLSYVIEQWLNMYERVHAYMSCDVRKRLTEYL